MSTLALVALLAAGCSGAPILANPPVAFPSPAVTAAPTSPPPDPIAIAFPRDDGPHDRLTEWWYYTGHLQTATGRRFGFEAVIFRAERSAVPTAWASHLALTDEQGRQFFYAQRSEIGPQVDHSPRDPNGNPTGFDLQIAGPSVAPAAGVTAALAPPWRLSGAEGTARIEAALAPAEADAAGADFALSLSLSTPNPAALHDGDGFVDFGPAGSSYYYSRPRLQAEGTLRLGDEGMRVTGTAWFDHQWGDFVSVGGGGWDWFAINLGQQGDFALSVVRDADGKPVLVYGTAIEPGGATRHLSAGDFTIETLGSWTSPHTGRTWSSGWRVSIGVLTIELRPTVADQELDTRPTTGVAYWEGSQVVTASLGGEPLEGGEAYVELTRYTN